MRITAYLAVYQGKERIRVREFDQYQMAMEWLEEQMPNDATVSDECFWNDDGQFIEVELRGFVEGDTGEIDYEVIGWLYDQELM